MKTYMLVILCYLLIMNFNITCNEKKICKFIYLNIKLRMLCIIYFIWTTDCSKRMEYFFILLLLFILLKGNAKFLQIYIFTHTYVYICICDVHIKISQEPFLHQLCKIPMCYFYINIYILFKNCYFGIYQLSHSLK